MNTDKRDALAVTTASAFTVEVENIGLGTLRASGTYIGMLLQMEDPAMRVSVLVDVICALGIKPEEILNRYYAISCDHCGMLDSPIHPCECKRRKISS